MIALPRFTGKMQIEKKRFLKCMDTKGGVGLGAG